MSVEVVIRERECILRTPDSKESMLSFSLTEQFPQLSMHRNVNNKINVVTDAQNSLTISFNNNIRRDIFALVVRYFCAKAVDTEDNVTNGETVLKVSQDAVILIGRSKENYGEQ